MIVVAGYKTFVDLGCLQRVLRSWLLDLGGCSGRGANAAGGVNELWAQTDAGRGDRLTTVAGWQDSH